MGSDDIMKILNCFPTGYVKPSNNFFLNANNCFLQTYKRLGVISCRNTEDNDAKQQKKIFCDISGCHEYFSNVEKYQSHYNSVHRYLCIECSKSLPTAHLLDLHILEQHDSFFAACVARGDYVISCFLDECKEKFNNPTDRKEHCIRCHKFPGDYRFDQISHKSRKSRSDNGMIKSNSNEYKWKNISFGHQKEKTFSTKKVNKPILNVIESLESMDTLNEVLNDI